MPQSEVYQRLRRLSNPPAPFPHAFLAEARGIAAPATWQIDEWKIGRTVLVRALEMVEPGKMGTGNKVLRNTTSEPIKHAKLSPKIAELDALIVGQSPQTCPRGPKGEKRPSATQCMSCGLPRARSRIKTPAKQAKEYARKGGLKGGNARAKALTPEQRSEITRTAAEARWTKPR